MGEQRDLIFKDRHDAGKKLSKALLEYKNAKDTIIIALPRGGVILGYEIAKDLNLPLDIVSPRKLGAPFNPEYAIGAITETGEKILQIDAISSLGITEGELERIIQKEKEEAFLRLKRYRKNRLPRNVAQKKVIIVDDGLATGSTMEAAIKTMKAEKASSIIVAIPVAPQDTLSRLKKECDKIICLTSPPNFYAVSQFYENFTQTTDEEVIEALDSF